MLGKLENRQGFQCLCGAVGHAVALGLTHYRAVQVFPAGLGALGSLLGKVFRFLALLEEEPLLLLRVELVSLGNVLRVVFVLVCQEVRNVLRSHT